MINTILDVMLFVGTLLVAGIPLLSLGLIALILRDALRQRRYSSSLFVLVSILGLGSQLNAAPVSFASGDGENEWNDKTGTNVVLQVHPVWDSTGPGKWISAWDTGSEGLDLPNSTAAPVASFYETFAIAYLDASKTGALRVFADDTARVSLNGFVLAAPDFTFGSACAPAGSITCTPGNGYLIDIAPYYQLGLNTIRFDLFQTGGNASGLKYDGFFDGGTPIDCAEAPEPSTIGMAAAGALLVFWRRRR